MLHVIEKLPEHMDDRLKDLLGTHQWEEMVTSHKTHARKSLLGKQSTNSVIREAIHKFCKTEGIDDTECNLKAHEIIVSDGELIEDILRNAEQHACDLIVIGGHHSSLFSKTSMSSTAKGLLKKSKIPVTVVPAVET
jgi:nucleotide-binding universal stress UspA family protein